MHNMQTKMIHKYTTVTVNNYYSLHVQRNEQIIRNLSPNSYTKVVYLKDFVVSLDVGPVQLSVQQVDVFLSSFHVLNDL